MANAEARIYPFQYLGPDAVLDAVESLGYEANGQVFALNSYENRVYQIGLEDQGKLVCKFYRPDRWSDEQILEEHRFSQDLTDLDIPVVAPLSIGGRTLQICEIEGELFRFAVFPYQPGRAPEFDQEDHLEVIGRFLGRVHRVGAQADFAYRPTFSVKSFAEDSASYLLENDFIPLSLLQAYESLSQDLIGRLNDRFKDVAGQVANFRVHGDCHPGNVLWQDSTPFFVDLDDARNGPAVQDLWMLLSGDDMQMQRQLGIIVEAYEQFYEFDVRELVLIEPLRTMRMMHYAAWLARRWVDPAFPRNFPWFESERFWSDHVLALREQLAALDAPPLRLSVYR